MTRTSIVVILLLAANRPSAAAASSNLPPAPSPAAAAADLPPVRLEVIAFSETRQSAALGRSSIVPIPGTLLTLAVKVATESMPANSSVRRIQLSKVIDNLGRNLSPNVVSLSLNSLPNASVIVRPPGPELPRNAKSLQLEGTVDIYQPTEANGGIIRIPNIRSHSGQLEHPALAQLGITFHFLGDNASYQEARRLSSMMFGGGGFTTPDSINSVGFLRNDPSRLISRIEIQDAAGRSILVASTFSDFVGSLIILSDLSQPLPGDAQLVIYLAVPAAITTAPFKLENFPLY